MGTLASHPNHQEPCFFVHMLGIPFSGIGLIETRALAYIVSHICARYLQAKIIKNEETELTYRTTEPPRDVHVKMLQENIDTLEKVFNYVAKTHSTKRCLGTRQILSEEDETQPNGRVFKKYNMGDYKWKNFIEAERMAASFGRGLRELGQAPRQNIVIFAETRAEWMIAAHGCFKQAMPIVTVYATLGDDGVAHCTYTETRNYDHVRHAED